MSPTTTDEINIRRDGHAGWITLTRPKALNALTYDMVLAIEAALDAWRDEVQVVIIDAEGDKAFCAGGDIADMYASGQRGDLDYGRQFWRDEYRLNAKIFEYPKPIVSFLQGFTMGGGVGIGCHGSHRIVGESSQIAMPECGIGLVPDVGGSLLLACGPGQLGSYLGTTGTRMGPGDAIYAGFADHFVPEAEWSDLKEWLTTGAINIPAYDAPDSPLSANQAEIDKMFKGVSRDKIINRLSRSDNEWANRAQTALMRGAPLAQACALAMQKRLRPGGYSLRYALDLEFCYTSRAISQGDFIEGIRAAIIEKDKSPVWAHGPRTQPPEAEIQEMLAPPTCSALNWKEMP